MEGLGYECVVPEHLRSPAVATFYYPRKPQFDFEYFFNGLKSRGKCIYPGMLTSLDRPTFRIGTIGRHSRETILDLVQGVREITAELDLLKPVKSL